MQKVSITSDATSMDATLWAELAKCRHENFCSPFLLTWGYSPGCGHTQSKTVEM